jgi:hypothetical protein
MGIIAAGPHRAASDARSGLLLGFAANADGSAAAQVTQLLRLVKLCHGFSSKL